jgi:hypothetical protein
MAGASDPNIVYHLMQGGGTGANHDAGNIKGPDGHQVFCKGQSGHCSTHPQATPLPTQLANADRSMKPPEEAASEIPVVFAPPDEIN